MSMAQNLVLGLLGGFRVDASGANPVMVYDPSTIGMGPMSLNITGSAKQLRELRRLFETQLHALSRAVYQCLQKKAASRLDFVPHESIGHVIESRH